jgi:SPP1 family phage portal protein
MYTVPKGTPLTADLIASAIDYNENAEILVGINDGETRKDRFDMLEDYYTGDHDILHRIKAPTSSNNKVLINHAKYIVDTNIGYLLGNPVSYKMKDGNDEVLKPFLEQLDMQIISDLDNEIAKDIAIFGTQYELGYNVDNNIKSKDIDVRNCVCIYDNTVDHEKLYGIVYTKKDKDNNEDTTYEYLVVYDKDFKWNCTNALGEIIVDEGSKERHLFGVVPVIEYRNNSEEQGDFEQVKYLIDAYNLLQSDRINDKEQLVDAILAGYGVNLTKSQMEELRENRTMFGLPLEAKVEYLIKTLDEGQVDILRKTIEADIHKISQTPNMSDENFVGNSSGVAIRYKLLAFEQNIKNKERYFEKGLMERFEIYNNYLFNTGRMPKVEKYKVDIVFKRNLPQNELEIAQMISYLISLVDRETLVAQIPFVENPAEVVERKDKEDEEKFAQDGTNYGTLEENVEKEGKKSGEEVKTKKDSLLKKLSDLMK